MKKKILVAISMVACAVLLVVGSVAGTLAYLSSKDSVKNTFTVGKVVITLDEAKVDAYGAVEGTTRVEENEYKLIPGHEYVKDPTIHVEGGSEACYLFVKIENGIAAIEGGTTIAAQLSANGWTALDGVTGVYYKEQGAVDADTDVPVFSSFTIRPDADVSTYASAEVNIVAYAVQQDGFTSAAGAWTGAGFN